MHYGFLTIFSFPDLRANTWLLKKSNIYFLFLNASGALLSRDWSKLHKLFVRKKYAPQTSSRRVVTTIPNVSRGLSHQSFFPRVDFFGWQGQVSLQRLGAFMALLRYLSQSRLIHCAKDPSERKLGNWCRVLVQEPPGGLQSSKWRPSRLQQVLCLWRFRIIVCIMTLLVTVVTSHLTNK